MRGGEKSASPSAGLKWEFTTQNFAGLVPVSPETAKEFINYAKKQGLQWIELRDPNASLSVEQCREIAAFAKEQGIEVNYSAQRGLLADDFREIFDRAVANTAVFDGPRVVRMLALRGRDEHGWTKEEFARAVAVANEAADRTAAQGIRFTVENADVALDGRGQPYYGMTELLEATAPKVLLQLDTANLFTGPVPVTPEQAEEFIRKYASRVSYLHLKSARDGKALPVLDGNPLDFKTILSIFASHGMQYLPRLQFSENRILQSPVMNPADGTFKRFGQGGLDVLKDESRPQHYGLYCGSLMGDMRNWLGVVNLSYLLADDEALFKEIIETVAELDYKNTEYILKTGARFDFAHFWEDICFKNGPLVSPAVFAEYAGHHYKRITGLLLRYGIDIVSVDCDGWIDSLVPTWLENGVNTMFPIEVGTWNADIEPWRKKYGKALRGVGGMNKTVFSRDRAAIDAEIERLRPLVELGGYIPCPDHRIAPDAEWDNVCYYCDRMHEVFSK